MILRILFLLFFAYLLTMALMLVSQVFTGKKSYRAAKAVWKQRFSRDLMVFAGLAALIIVVMLATGYAN